MKKLILAACLMVSAVFASFGAVQANNLGIGPNSSPMWSFTFTSDGSWGLEFGSYTMNYRSITSFGYYFIDDPTTWYSGTLTGNNSIYFSNLGISFADANTGFLGDFKTGDTIGIWIITNKSGINGTYTSTDTGIHAGWIGSLTQFSNFNFNMGENGYHWIEMENPNPPGAPLPGVMAALAISGCVSLGRKIRNKIKK